MISKNLFPLLLLSLAIGCKNSEQKAEQKRLVYPVTKKTDTVDTYFNTKVADPYRWLEDDKSTETSEWVKTQNALTFDYLSKIPFRDKIKERLTKIWNFEKRGVPFKKGKNYFYYKNDGIQNQSVLYVMDGLTGTPRVLLDPNTFAQDGTASLGDLSISKNGKYLAYTINRAGSDWSTIYALEIESGKKLSEELQWVKFSNIAWKDDGFYYSAYDAPKAGGELSNKNEFHKVFYHKLGNAQKQDELIFEDKKQPQHSFSAATTEDEKLLIIYISESTSGNAIAVKELSKKNSAFVSLIDNFENTYTVIDNVGSNLIVLTDKGAPKYQLLEMDYTKKTPYESWKKLIPESTDLLESVSLFKDKFIVDYLKDVTTRLYIYDRTGKQEKEIKLPGLGKANSLVSYKDEAEVFFSYSTFTAPSIVYKYDPAADKLDTWFQPKIDFKSDDYETKQVFYPSKDGTKIPMFITCKKGLKLDGNNPCYLYGYGGFNAIYTPAFRMDCAVFLENGGIYAIPGLRGGGDYGEEWHKAGIKLKKQNVFDDFIAAAEYLIKEKYTSSAKLAINGRSNGGLLIGAVMTQRPDLAKVAIPTVGVMDMLRYHKFTIGYAWASDYGTSENEEEFKYILNYSPLHNIKEIEYPATLVITGDHDDRVVPAHSFKFIATLQEKQKGTEPVLIRIDTNAGHGTGKPTSKQIDEFSDIWSFIFYNLGMTY
ncbi:MAG TPA: prolyl oligopeptidase family serine peptidase [Bacteroidia bacterium]|nr:prolyl oligopeptidase family serine peptidase [Bacteroidia bacterium]